jgi:hypothetical protein
MTADSRTRATLPHALAALAIATMVIALVNAETHVGVTVDEYGHLVRGLAFWWAPDTRLAWPHPPLPHAIVALPTVLGGSAVDLTALGGWEDADFTRTVKAYWAHVGYDVARAQLVAGRRMMIAVAALVAAYLWWWSRRRMGPTIAMVVLLLWLSSTVLLAHATLVTNDFAAACAALVVTTTLLDVLRRPRPRRIVGFGLACGVALVTKLSLVPIVALAIVVPIAVVRSWPAVRRSAATLGLAWLVVLATYRFDRIVLTVGDYNAKEGTPGWRGGPEHPLALPSAIPLVLPHSWVFSAQFIRKQNARGHAGWFWGERNEGGDPLYFPTLALFKTPLGTLALFGAGVLGVAIALRRRRRPDVVASVGLGFLLAFFAMASASRINIGFRHAAPSIGWMVLVAGRGAAWCWRRRRPGRVGATAASTLGAAFAWPLFLGDFNVLAGGRSGGLGINLAEEDWGQDMPDLAAYLVEQRARPVHLFARSSTMTQELRHFGVQHRVLKCKEPATGWIAIGVKDWTERAECFAWLDAPVVRIVNDHVFVFVVDAR